VYYLFNTASKELIGIIRGKAARGNPCMKFGPNG